jgi:hypothetical protein
MSRIKIEVIWKAKVEPKCSFSRGRSCMKRSSQLTICRRGDRITTLFVLFVTLSAFRPGGSLDRRVNCRRVSQPRWVGARRSTKGGEERKRGNSRPPCCPAPRSGALAVGGYKRPRGGRARDPTRRPVLPRGQPSRKRALVLPFIGVRRGPRCIVGGVAMC